jgi:hypothetical protein
VCVCVCDTYVVYSNIILHKIINLSHKSVNNDITRHNETRINHVRTLPDNIITSRYYFCYKVGANTLLQSLSKLLKRYILLHPTEYYCTLLHPVTIKETKV